MHSIEPRPAPFSLRQLENVKGKQTAKPSEPLLFEDEHGSKIAFTANPDGSIAYMYSNKSKQAMTRQEAAALLYLASKWSLVP